MPTIGSLTTLAAGKAYRSEVNGNFTTIRTAVNTYAAFVDATCAVTSVWTFTASPAFPAAVTFALGATVTAGGVTITSGGLTVTAGASTFGAAVGITGTCTATTFSGSGASLTAIPAAQITGTAGAFVGTAITALNGSNITSGTVSASYLPTSYSALTVTTLTADALTKTVTGNAATINLAHGTGGYFFVIGSGHDALSAVAPSGGSSYYLTLRVGTDNYLIKAQKAT